MYKIIILVSAKNHLKLIATQGDSQTKSSLKQCFPTINFVKTGA